jgi:hypothetical protein
MYPGSEIGLLDQVVIRERIGMSSLPVELLLGELLIFFCILSTFTLVLLPFLAFICWSNHDGRLLSGDSVARLLI